MTDLEQLRAENARLRDALSELIEAVERDNWSNTQTGFTLHVARSALSADPAPAERPLSANDLYYLRAIQRRLNEFSDALDGIEALSIGGEAFADERDWLDCFIERNPAPVVKAWQPIETAPHATPVLLYCPDRGCPTNRERIELGCYSTGERVGHTSTMSYHSWATHWMPLPKPPAVENGND